MKRLGALALALALAACADFETEGDWQTDGGGPVPTSSNPTPTPTATATASPTGTPASTYKGIVINEFLLIEPTGTSLGDDTNRDGFVDNDDRFIEIVNDTGADLELNSLRVEVDYGNSSFGNSLGGGTLAQGRAVVIFAGPAAPTTTEACGAIVLANMIGSVSPAPNTMTITIESPTSEVSMTWTFASNASATRGPDLSGSFVDHPVTTDLSNVSRRNSPGCRADWTPFQ